MLLLAGGALLTLSCCLRPWPAGRLPRVPHLPPAPQYVKVPEIVSVLLARSATSLTASCPGGGVWLTMQNGVETQVAAGEGPWQLSVQDGVLMLDSQPVQTQVMALRSHGDTVMLGDRAYRGRLLVEARPDGQVAVSNTIPPEDYLRSVVGSEMFSRWDMNALMAQAVTARTYLIYEAAAKGRMTLMDMAYKGTAGESREADLAVDLTRGILMTYNSHPFPAYFSSTCGGHTASAAKVFGEAADGPMQGRECDYCRESTSYEWKAVIAAARIAAALADRGISEVDSIEPQGTGTDGYATTVLINGQLTVAANEFRLAVGPADLKSTRFTVAHDGDAFTFTGRGYGHGVGLCQWGAEGMAKDGKDWEEILHFYYFGVKLVQVK